MAVPALGTGALPYPNSSSVLWRCDPFVPPARRQPERPDISNLGGLAGSSAYFLQPSVLGVVSAYYLMRVREALKACPVASRMARIGYLTKKHHGTVLLVQSPQLGWILQFVLVRGP